LQSKESPILVRLIQSSAFMKELNLSQTGLSPVEARQVLSALGKEIEHKQINMN